MTDRPLIFTGPMVCALLEGRKTQTRRMLKILGHKSFSEFGPSDTPGYDWHFRDGERRWHDLRDSELLPRLPFFIGDRIWVRETVTWVSAWGWRYRADNDDLAEKRAAGEVERWTPSIFMPRWASRLTLTVTDVRVERLADISAEDARAEGAPAIGAEEGPDPDERSHVWGFHNLWNSIHGPEAWAENPWVCAISFNMHKCNIGKMSGGSA